MAHPTPVRQVGTAPAPAVPILTVGCRARRRRATIAPMRTGLVVLLALGATLGCAEPGESGELVATEEDFASFRDWPAFDLPEESLTESHANGPRRLYYSDVPDSPEAPFPVGTILVKTVENGAPTEWEIHAMVKRGGGFNEAGAQGWEFFDLDIDASGVVRIEWRGDGPPPGSLGYPGAGEGAGQCNGCHWVVPERDYVFLRAMFD